MWENKDDLKRALPTARLLTGPSIPDYKQRAEYLSLLERSSSSDTMPRSNKVQSVANKPKRKATVSSVNESVAASTEPVGGGEPLPPPSASPQDVMESSSTSTLVNENNGNNSKKEELPLQDINESKQETVETAANGAIRGKRNSIITGGPPSLFFSDGKRQIDYILAYDDNGVDEDEDDDDSVMGDHPNNDEEKALDDLDGIPMRKNHWRKATRRRIFEENLEKLGLQLEWHESDKMDIKFVLIHAPFKVLCKQAELLKIRMPVYINDAKKLENNLMDGLINKFLQRFKFLDFGGDVQKRMDSEDYFTQPFIEQHMDCFIGHEDRQNFFPRTARSRMVYDFLIRTRYDRSDSDKFRAGIERLLKNYTYAAAYPLHDEIDWYNPPELTKCSDRQLLYECWVKFRNFYKYQPLHLIQRYFGTKIGLYFAWLGYYTRFLYGIAVIGIVCVIWGAVTMSSDVASNDICAENGIGSRVLICPSCDEFCDYVPLSGSCVYAKLTYLFDNTSTIVFAALMSIWATLFLECWKRYHAELAYKWNIHDLETEDEIMRPEFQFRIRRRKINPATQIYEPYLPLYEKIIRVFGSGMTVLFFLCLVIALVIGIIVYRAIVMQVFYAMEGVSFIQSKAVIVTSITAASINLFYNILALKLTEYECPRTQLEFESSYTVKVFLFQFINFYSSLFYIAFVKGRLSGAPGSRTINNKQIQIDGHRLEECDPAGCMFELVVQLLIIMCGKQFYNSFLEMGYPIVLGWFRRWHIRLPESKKEQLKRERIQQQHDVVDANPETVTLYEKDFALNGPTDQFLFDEYLEMVIQFGFITLFVAAFPLAPFFALINNIMEIRLDAYKFIVTSRKPMPAQAKNIGIWLTILDILSNLAVICNAFVIAFTSDFIPKLYYYSTRFTMEGYVEFSLSYFDARNLNVTKTDYPDVTVCRYRDFRKPPCTLLGNDTTPFNNDVECGNSYEYATEYWIIFAYRLIFVLIFEHVVLTIKSLFAYLIPDIPTKIVVQIQREKYLARQAILQRQDDLMTQRDDSPVSTYEPNDQIFNEKSKPADNDDIAVQPGNTFADGIPFEKPSAELSRIIGKLSRHASTSSRASQTPSRQQSGGMDSELNGPRFRGIITRAAKERDAEVIDEIINDLSQPPRDGSIESFHTCNQSSTNNLNNAGK
uniref:Anoctamin n=1 Tax=Panagrolaimus sp. ES5 TaxID=591445 RepID=A0AC34GSS8_9BILA